jgi:hypothetical protein
MRFLLLLVLALAGCRIAPSRLPEAPRDAATSRAALATLVVDNQTRWLLRVGYEYLESGGGIVVVGSVAPASVDTVARIPAREPIILFARDSTGAELRDSTRALELDATFVWRIPENAAFTPRTP